MILQAQKGMSYIKPAHSATSSLPIPLATKILPSLAAALFSPSSLAFWMITLNGIVSGMKEGKEIPWFLTESRKAWQKASALPKSENVGGYEKGPVFSFR